MPVAGAKAQQPCAVAQADHALPAHEPAVAGKWIRLIDSRSNEHPPAFGKLPVHVRTFNRLACGRYAFMFRHSPLLSSQARGQIPEPEAVPRHSRSSCPPGRAHPHLLVFFRSGTTAGAELPPGDTACPAITEATQSPGSQQGDCRLGGQLQRFASRRPLPLADP